MLCCKVVHFRNLNNVKVESLFFLMKITYGLYNQLQQREFIKQKCLQCPMPLPRDNLDSSYWEQKYHYISLERNAMAVMITWIPCCRSPGLLSLNLRVSQPVLSIPAELTEMHQPTVHCSLGLLVIKS